MTPVRAHVRRKPSKPAIYLETHRRLKEDVEAMRRGELRSVEPAKPFVVRALSAIAEALRGGVRRWLNVL